MPFWWKLSPVFLHLTLRCNLVVQPFICRNEKALSVNSFLFWVLSSFCSRFWCGLRHAKSIFTGAWICQLLPQFVFTCQQKFWRSYTTSFVEGLIWAFDITDTTAFAADLLCYCSKFSLVEWSTRQTTNQSATFKCRCSPRHQSKQKSTKAGRIPIRSRSDANAAIPRRLAPWGISPRSGNLFWMSVSKFQHHSLR